jgi:hypothetical protein
MTQLAAIPAIAWAILAFAAWRSTELLNAWRHSPLDRFGWIAFLLWLTPVAVRFIQPSPPGLHPAAPWFLGASLAASIFGILADFNTAHYVGLSCAVAALGGWSWRHAVWFAAAAAWMPAFSWAGQDLPRPALIAARIAATSIASAPLLGFLVFTKPRPSLP